MLNLSAVSRQLDLFQFLEDISSLFQEASSVPANWRGVGLLLNSVWVCLSLWVSESSLFSTCLFRQMKCFTMLSLKILEPCLFCENSALFLFGEVKQSSRFLLRSSHQEFCLTGIIQRNYVFFIHLVLWITVSTAVPMNISCCCCSVFDNISAVWDLYPALAISSIRSRISGSIKISCCSLLVIVAFMVFMDMGLYLVCSSLCWWFNWDGLLLIWYTFNNVNTREHLFSRAGENSQCVSIRLTPSNQCSVVCLYLSRNPHTFILNSSDPVRLILLSVSVLQNTHLYWVFGSIFS